MFTQIKDTRLNNEKPKTTYQEAYWANVNGEQVRMLKVHVSDDPNSEVYFHGLAEDYLGGATYDDSKE